MRHSLFVWISSFYLPICLTYTNRITNQNSMGEFARIFVFNGHSLCEIVLMYDYTQLTGRILSITLLYKDCYWTFILIWLFNISLCRLFNYCPISVTAMRFVTVDFKETRYMFKRTRSLSNASLRSRPIIIKLIRNQKSKTTRHLVSKNIALQLQ